MNATLKMGLIVLALGAVLTAMPSRAYAADLTTPLPGTSVSATKRLDDIGLSLQKLVDTLHLSPEEQELVKPILAIEAAKISVVLGDAALTQDQKNTKLQQIRNERNYEITQRLTSDERGMLVVAKSQKSGQVHNPKRKFNAGALLLDLVQTLIGSIEEQDAVDPLLEDEAKKIKKVLDDATLTEDQKKTKLASIKNKESDKNAAFISAEYVKLFGPAKPASPKPTGESSTEAAR